MDGTAVVLGGYFSRGMDSDPRAGGSTGLGSILPCHLLPQSSSNEGM